MDVDFCQSNHSYNLGFHLWFSFFILQFVKENTCVNVNKCFYDAIYDIITYLNHFFARSCFKF